MAAPAIITCPACEKKFKGKPELAGKRIKCPACSIPFLVPDAAPVAVQPPPKQKPQNVAPAAAAKSTSEYDQNPDPYGITFLDTSARCPNCANKMESEEAIICLFCGYNTQTRSLGATKKLIEHTLGERLIWLAPGIAGVLAILLLLWFQLFLCTSMGEMVQNSWLRFLDAESIRLWASFILLAVCWAIGYFVFKRLIENPTPPDKEMA